MFKVIDSSRKIKDEVKEKESKCILYYNQLSCWLS